MELESESQISNYLSSAKIKIAWQRTLECYFQRANSILKIGDETIIVCRAGIPQWGDLNCNGQDSKLWVKNEEIVHATCTVDKIIFKTGKMEKSKQFTLAGK